MPRGLTFREINHKQNQTWISSKRKEHAKQLHALKFRSQCWTHIQISCRHRPLRSQTHLRIPRALRSFTEWLASTQINFQGWVAKGKLATGYALALFWLTDHAGELLRKSGCWNRPNNFQKICWVVKARMIALSCKEAFLSILEFTSIGASRETDISRATQTGSLSLIIRHEQRASHECLKLLKSNLEKAFITQNI